MLKALSVTELSNYIGDIFEAEELLQYIQVYGEVSNVNLVRGNLYFNLKDENSCVSCIMFNCSSMIKEGDQVLVTGGIGYYSKQGKLNLYVRTISPYGSGVLYQKFLQLKDKLEKEGIFSKKTKEEIPKSISTIGVVTSSTGAVIHDIETVCHRRNPMLNIIVYPSKVQGEGADNTIIKGLKYFDRRKDVDVIIIARGGGSIEDLQPFNSEKLARCIAKTKKPVISSVGHETDFTICDFASSLRAATPTEAAEFVSIDLGDRLKTFKNRLDKLENLVFSNIDEKYNFTYNKSKDMYNLYEKFLNKKIANFKILSSKIKRLNFLDNFENKINLKDTVLKSLNPKEILKKGYAKVFLDKVLVKSSREIKENNDIEIEFLDGNVLAKVRKIDKGEQK